MILPCLPPSRAARPGTAIARPHGPAARTAGTAAAAVETGVVPGAGVVVAGVACAHPAPSSATAPAANTTTQRRLTTSLTPSPVLQVNDRCRHRRSPLYAIDAQRTHSLHPPAWRAACPSARHERADSNNRTDAPIESPTLRDS